MDRARKLEKKERNNNIEHRTNIGHIEQRAYQIAIIYSSMHASRPAHHHHAVAPSHLLCIFICEIVSQHCYDAIHKVYAGTGGGIQELIPQDSHHHDMGPHDASFIIIIPAYIFLPPAAMQSQRFIIYYFYIIHLLIRDQYQIVVCRVEQSSIHIPMV